MIRSASNRMETKCILRRRILPGTAGRGHGSTIARYRRRRCSRTRRPAGGPAGPARPTMPCCAPAHQRRVLDAAAGTCRSPRPHRELHRRTARDRSRAARRPSRRRSGAVSAVSTTCVSNVTSWAALAAAPGGSGRGWTAQRQRLAHAVEIRSAADEIDDVLLGEEHSADSAVHLALTRLAQVERRAPPGSTGAARELLEAALVHRCRGGYVGAHPRKGRRTRSGAARLESSTGSPPFTTPPANTGCPRTSYRSGSPPFAQEMEGLESGEERIRELEKTYASAGALYREAAERLSASRTAAAGRLAGEVTRRIRELGVGAGEFSIAVRPSREDRASGIDDVEFRVRINPGHPPTPFARTASGGRAVADKPWYPGHGPGGAAGNGVTTRFDAGVGGRVAELVGRHLRRLAENRQVLCVTHLPQVASQAHGHLTVSKGANGFDDERKGAEGERRGTNRGNRANARRGARHRAFSRPRPGDARSGAGCGGAPVTGRIRAGVAALLAAAVWAGAGCAKLPEIPVPGLYRLDVRPGQRPRRRSPRRLETGMDRSRVLHLLGSPAISGRLSPGSMGVSVLVRPRRRAVGSGGGSPSISRTSRLVRIEGNVRARPKQAPRPSRPE